MEKKKGGKGTIVSPSPSSAACVILSSGPSIQTLVPDTFFIQPFFSPVCPVHLVSLVYLVQPNKRDRPDKQ